MSYRRLTQMSNRGLGRYTLNSGSIVDSNGPRLMSYTPKPRPRPPLRDMFPSTQPYQNFTDPVDRIGDWVPEMRQELNQSLDKYERSMFDVANRSSEAERQRQEQQMARGGFMGTAVGQRARERLAALSMANKLQAAGNVEAFRADSSRLLAQLIDQARRSQLGAATSVYSENLGDRRAREMQKEGFAHELNSIDKLLQILNSIPLQPTGA